MSRRLEVAPDDYPEFRATVKGLIKEGRLDVAKDKTLRLPGATATANAPGTVIGLFRRSSKGFGFVRPHHVTEKFRTDLHPARRRPRRLQRRRGGRQDHQAAEAARG